MMRESLARSVRHLALAPLALWVAGLVAPAAKAGCVHDVLGALHPTASAAHLEHLAEAGAIPVPEAPGRPRPCSGPSCSDNSGLPPSPSAPPSSRVETWAAWAASAAMADPGEGVLRADAASVRPIRRASPLLRPPRATS